MFYQSFNSSVKLDGNVMKNKNYLILFLVVFTFWFLWPCGCVKMYVISAHKTSNRKFLSRLFYFSYLTCNGNEDCQRDEHHRILKGKSGRKKGFFFWRDKFKVTMMELSFLHSYHHIIQKIVMLLWRWWWWWWWC